MRRVCAASQSRDPRFENVDPESAAHHFVLRSIRGTQTTKAGSNAGRFSSLPRPACGERSKPKASGEGDSPRVECVDRAPHPNPLPAKSGARERTGALLRRFRRLQRRIIRIALCPAAVERRLVEGVERRALLAALAQLWVGGDRLSERVQFALVRR